MAKVIMNDFQAQISRNLAASFSDSWRLSLQILPCYEKLKLHGVGCRSSSQLPQLSPAFKSPEEERSHLSRRICKAVVSIPCEANQTHPFQSSHLKTQTSWSRQTSPSVSEFLAKEFVRISWWLFLQDFWVV